MTILLDFCKTYPILNISKDNDFDKDFIMTTTGLDNPVHTIIDLDKPEQLTGFEQKFYEALVALTKKSDKKSHSRYPEHEKLIIDVVVALIKENRKVDYEKVLAQLALHNSEDVDTILGALTKIIKDLEFYPNTLSNNLVLYYLLKSRNEEDELIAKNHYDRVTELLNHLSAIQINLAKYGANASNLYYDPRPAQLPLYVHAKIAAAFVHGETTKEDYEPYLFTEEVFLAWAESFTQRLINYLDNHSFLTFQHDQHDTVIKLINYIHTILGERNVPCITRAFSIMQFAVNHDPGKGDFHKAIIHAQKNLQTLSHIETKTIKRRLVASHTDNLKLKKASAKNNVQHFFSSLSTTGKKLAPDSPEFHCRFLKACERKFNEKYELTYNYAFQRYAHAPSTKSTAEIQSHYVNSAKAQAEVKAQELGETSFAYKLFKSIVALFSSKHRNNKVSDASKGLTTA